MLTYIRSNPCLFYPLSFSSAAGLTIGGLYGIDKLNEIESCGKNCSTEEEITSIALFLAIGFSFLGAVAIFGYATDALLCEKILNETNNNEPITDGEEASAQELADLHLYFDLEEGFMEEIAVLGLVSDEERTEALTEEQESEYDPDSDSELDSEQDSTKDCTFATLVGLRASV